ncbi:MAG: hypothetical protein QXG02_02640 [Candidatus Anstonellales archaeon]
MRAIFFILAAILVMPLLFAGTNCEVACCRDYKGKWDTEWDRCWRPQPGYEECVSDCTAQTIHYYSSHIDKSDIKEPIECKIGAFILFLAFLLFFAKIR